MAGGAVGALLDDGVDGDPVVIVRGAGLAGAGYEPEWGHVENAAGHELAGQLELVRVERTRLAHKPGDLHMVTDVTLRIMVDLLEP